MRASFFFNHEKIDEKTVPTDEQSICLSPVNLRHGKNVLEIAFQEVRPFSEQDRRELGLRVLEIQVGNERTEVADAGVMRPTFMLEDRSLVSTSG
jgi:hypothetical protein